MKRPMRLEIYRSFRDLPEIAADPRSPLLDSVPGWRWRIRASNGRILADSGEAYGRLRDCAHGAGLVTGIRLGNPRPGAEWMPRRGDQVWRITVES